MKWPRLIAHRGASKYAPENTLAALEKACAQGASWVEFDVQLSRDGQAVVIHDETLLRTTGQAGCVYDYPLSALQAMDVGSFFDPAYQTQRMPSLRDWLKRATELGLYLNLELKPALYIHHEILIENVLNEVALFFPDAQEKLLVSSFDLDCLQKFHEAAPNFSLGLLLHAWEPDWRLLAKALNAACVHVNAGILTRTRAAEILSHGYKLLSYTINDKHEADALFALGVDAIFSDDPLLLNPA